MGSKDDVHGLRRTGVFQMWCITSNFSTVVHCAHNPFWSYHQKLQWTDISEGKCALNAFHLAIADIKLLLEIVTGRLFARTKPSVWRTKSDRNPIFFFIV